MWWETKAAGPGHRRTCSSARPPRQHRAGDGPAAGGGPGEPPDPDAAAPLSWTDRTTESSLRMWMARSWIRKQSAMASSRSKASLSAEAIGSSEMLHWIRQREPCGYGCWFPTNTGC